ncbi:MAG: thioredoxin family protein [Casimicrobiaceae bacterium]
MHCARLAGMMLSITLAWMSPACAQDAKFDPSRDAAADVAHAVVQAKASARNVLVDVGGEWCSWCHILDDFFAADGDARALRDQDYVTVKVNWSPQNRNAALLARWPRIDGYPHLFVLDANGKLLRSQSTGELELGHGYDRAKLLAFLRRYAPHATIDKGRAAPSRAG